MVGKYTSKELIEIVYFENGKYHISSLKVHYIDKDEGEVVKFVGQEGKEWWIDFSKKWKGTFELKGFKEVEISQEQLDRLEKVNELKLPEGVPLVDLYVLEGKFTTVIDDEVFEIGKSHPLYVLRVEKELKDTSKQNEFLNIKNNALEEEIELVNEGLFELIMTVYSEE